MFCAVTTNSTLSVEMVKLSRAVSSILLSQLLGSHRDLQTGNIFMSRAWMVENLEAGNVHPSIYTRQETLKYMMIKLKFI